MNSMTREGARGVFGARGLVVMLALALSLGRVGLVSLEADACVGARPLGMGGAFVAVADDVSSVYWNPAGLAGLQHKEVTFTHTVNNRDFFNYDEFLAYGQPVSHRTALGVGWVREHIGSRPSSTGGSHGGGLYYSADWFMLSYARAAQDNLYYGINVRHELHRLEIFAKPPLDGERWSFDLGLLYKPSSKVSLGLLAQDANASPVYWQDGSRWESFLNLRPGLTYRLDGDTVLAFDVYDALDALGAQTFRVGGEKRIFDRWQVRLGYYGISRFRGAITAGLGYKAQGLEVDYAFLGKGVEPGDPGLGETHQVGVTARF